MAERRPSQHASPRSAPPPLDAAGLDRLALRYVERFATTRGRLAAYLTRKVRDRGWDGPPADPAAVAERMASLGYVDDRGYAEAKAAAMARRGLGARRVAGAWREAGIAPDDVAALEPVVADRAWDAAMAFARRRRIGPFGPPDVDRPTRERQIAAMLRAGHSFDVARKMIQYSPDDDDDVT